MLKILAAAIVVFVSAGCDTTGARRAPETATARSPVPEPSQAGGPRLETSEADLGGGVKLELVKISAGEFQMGSPSGETDRYDYEGPVHTVRIDKPFWLGKYEVTQAEWEAVMGSNPSNFKGARNPVEQVSWNDCQEFLGKLNARVPGGGFRLPTEAEWEYACRAGTRTRFSHGDDPGYGSLGQYGWFDKNSGNKTHPVGGPPRKRPRRREQQLRLPRRQEHAVILLSCLSLFIPFRRLAPKGRFGIGGEGRDA